MTKTFSLLLISTALTLGACGGSSGSSSSAPSNVSEAQVASALGIHGLHADGCYALPLPSSQEVDTYKNAGDTVATNDSGTVGVKTFADSPTQTDAACVSHFTDLLNKNF